MKAKPMYTTWLFTDRSGSSSWRRLGTGCLFALGISMALWIRSASAVVLVNDTWLDGNDTEPGAAPVLPFTTAYSENGTDADADGNLESTWYQSGGGSLDPTSYSGANVERGDFTTATGSATWSTYFT